MILRPRGLMVLGAALVVLGLATGFLALMRFSDDPWGMVFEDRDRVVIPLPDSIGRLVLERRALGVMGLDLYRRRLLVLEMAGNPVVETRVFASDRPDDPVRVSWVEPAHPGGTPLVRLQETAGEILVDPVSPAMVRVLPTPVGPVLTSPAGDARAGAVIGADGTVHLTDGLSGAGLPDHPGVLLGLIETGSDGRLVYTTP